MSQKIKAQLRKQGVKVGQALYDDKGLMGYFCDVPFEAIYSAGYQRGISNGHVTKLQGRFNLKAVQPLAVSFRDLYLWVFDGQHRVELLSREGFSSHYAFVYTGLSYDEEAQLFFELNDAPRRVNGWVKFKAAANAGNTTYKQLLAIADKNRLTTPMSPGISRNRDADIKSPIYLNFPFNKGGYPLVDAVCKVLDQCWRTGNRNTPVSQDAKETAIIRGLATFLKMYHVGAGHKLPWSTIKMVLKNVGPDGLTAEAKKCKAKRVDYRQYKDALCRMFDVPTTATESPSCHLRLVA